MNINLPDLFGFLQWPAMLVTIVASWWVASRSGKKRKAGFWIFLLSNLLWILWGWADHAYALILLQLCLTVMNIRGVMKNEDSAAAPEKP